MIKTAEKFAEDDEKFRRNREAHNNLEALVFATKQSEGEKNAELEEFCRDLENWLSDHPSEEASVYDEKMKELQDLAKKIHASTQEQNTEGEAGPKIEEVVEELD